MEPINQGYAMRQTSFWSTLVFGARNVPADPPERSLLIKRKVKTIINGNDNMRGFFKIITVSCLLHEIKP